MQKREIQVMMKSSETNQRGFLSWTIVYGNKTLLDLKVQPFICKDCHKTWVTDCSLVPKNSNISYDLTCQIMLYLKENFSRKQVLNFFQSLIKLSKEWWRNMKYSNVSRIEFIE